MSMESVTLEDYENYFNPPDDMTLTNSIVGEVGESYNSDSMSLPKPQSLEDSILIRP